MKLCVLAFCYSSGGMRQLHGRVLVLERVIGRDGDRGWWLSHSWLSIRTVLFLLLELWYWC